LTNSPASLLDAVSALTNQTLIRATFRPPLLLLHTAEDLLEPAIRIEHQPTADKIRRTRFVAHGVYNDRDWDYLRDVLRWSLRTEMRPLSHSTDSWHFYRHRNGITTRTHPANRTRHTLQTRRGYPVMASECHR
jgi:hypothetical protein